MTVTLRPAALADAESLGALHMTCWREAYGLLLSAAFFARATPESSAERWARAIPALRDDETLVLAEDDGGLVGFAHAGPGRGEAPPRERELYAIYTRAAVHGSGLGQRLLDAVIGSRPAALWVLDRNSRARAFYARNGFVADGATEVLERFEGLTEIRMVR